MEMDTPATLHRKSATRKCFKDAEIGDTFECNGNLWIKKSTRTASGVWPAYLPAWAYFGGHEVVNV